MTCMRTICDGSGIFCFEDFSYFSSCGVFDNIERNINNNKLIIIKRTHLLSEESITCDEKETK